MRIRSLVPRLSLIMALGACAVEEPGATSAGTTTDPTTDPGTETGDPVDPLCGNGALDPGEACDDGNLDEGDGCSPSCELGPCAWEWIEREAIGLDSAQGYLQVTPLFVAGDEATLAHQTGPQGARATRFLRSSTLDGASLASFELDLHAGDDYPYTLVPSADGDGDLFLGELDVDTMIAEIRRLSATGELRWQASYPVAGHIAGMGLAANGELVFVSSVEIAAGDRDALIVGLDPADGSERWVQIRTGPIAANGNSLDLGAGLALDPEGRRFVVYNEYRGADTSAVVLGAYAPGDSGAPLWETEIATPGKQLEQRVISLGPDGTVVIGLITIGGTYPFFLVGFERETGEALWQFDRDSLGLDLELSAIRGLSASEDRIMAVGVWAVAGDGEAAVESYALGLEPDGSLACLSTLTGPALGLPDHDLVATALVRSGDGFHVAGFASSLEPNIELFQAKLR